MLVFRFVEKYLRNFPFGRVDIIRFSLLQNVRPLLRFGKPYNPQSQTRFVDVIVEYLNVLARPRRRLPLGDERRGRAEVMRSNPARHEIKRPIGIGQLFRCVRFR